MNENKGWRTVRYSDSLRKRQTDGLVDRQIGRQTDRQTGRQTDSCLIISLRDGQEGQIDNVRQVRRRDRWKDS